LLASVSIGAILTVKEAMEGISKAHTVPACFALLACIGIA